MEMPSIGNADLDRDERIMESLRALIFFSSSSGRRTALGTAEVSEYLLPLELLVSPA
jgi:hypothetical protein